MFFYCVVLSSDFLFSMHSIVYLRLVFSFLFVFRHSLLLVSLESVILGLLESVVLVCLL